jgi:hypothetical protein
VLLAVFAYLASFGRALRPLGPDLFGYIWQTRLVGHAPLSAIEARPGIPVLGSMLAGLGVTSDRTAPFALALMTIVALGFAVGVTLRLAFRLPLWTVGVLGFVVTLWGGSVHLSQGHLANLLSLVAIVPAVALVTVPGGGWGPRVIAATAAATASGLAHAGFLPFYGAVAGVWLLISIPSLTRARREGSGWWKAPPCSFAIALGLAAIVVAIVVFGVIGVSLEGFTNIDDGIVVFEDRLTQITSGVGLWISSTSVFALAGIAVVWKLGRPRPLTLIHLGVAWAAVSVAGWLAAVAWPSFPGHRALGIILPIAALAGMGVVGVAMAIDDGLSGGAIGRWAEGGLVRLPIVALGVVTCCSLVVWPSLADLGDRANREARGELDRAVASYAAAVDPGRPVVVVVEPVRELAALSWRGRQNQIRGFAPRESIDRIFVLIGRLGDDLEPEPTAGPEGERDPAISYAVEQSWSVGGAAIREGAVVVALEPYVRDQVWRRLAADRDRIVMPGVAVVRGPRTAATELVPRAELPGGQAAWQVLAGLLVLVIVGGGFGAAAVLEREGSVLDALGLAPAFGAVLAVLVGVGVAIIGGDPAGIGAVLLVGSGAAAGYLLAWRRMRRLRDGTRAAPADGPSVPE